MERPDVAVIRSIIRGVGACVPKKVMTNADMAKLVDTSDDWITRMTGIKRSMTAHLGADRACC